MKLLERWLYYITGELIGMSHASQMRAKVSKCHCIKALSFPKGNFSPNDIILKLLSSSKMLHLSTFINS